MNIQLKLALEELHQDKAKLKGLVLHHQLMKFGMYIPMKPDFLYKEETWEVKRSLIRPKSRGERKKDFLYLEDMESKVSKLIQEFLRDKFLEALQEFDIKNETPESFKICWETTAPSREEERKNYLEIVEAFKTSIKEDFKGTGLSVNININQK